MGANCQLQMEKYYRDFYEERGCKRECPPAAEVAENLYWIALPNALEEELCQKAYHAFYFMLFFNWEYAGQGCDYDMDKIGLDLVGVDACELGRCGFVLVTIVVCYYRSCNRIKITIK